MAHYTVLSEKELLHILDEYAIQTLISYKVLSGGSENTNYLINGALVLTVCEHKKEEETRALAELLVHLSDNNFETSKIIKTKLDRLYINWNTKQIILKEYIAGHIVKNMSNKLLALVGEEIAKLHNTPVSKSINHHISFGVEFFDKIKNYEKESVFVTWLDIKTKEINQVISKDLPKAIVHSDVFYNNVIVSPDSSKLRIMDFEEAGYYYRIYDIAMAFIGLCIDDEKLNLNKAKSLIGEYQKHIKLLDNELNSLKMFCVYAATSIACWRYGFFNFEKPEENLQDHYREMKNIADHINQISDSDFNQIY